MSFCESFFRLLLLNVAKLLDLIRTLPAALNGRDRLFSSAVGLAVSCCVFLASDGWLMVFALLRHPGDPCGELANTEPSEWLEVALSREEHEQSLLR